MKKNTIIFAVTNDLTHDQRMQRICATLARRYEVVLVGRKLPLSKPLEAAIFQDFRTHRINCFFHTGKFFYIEFNIRLFFYLLKKTIVQKIDAFCAVDLDTIIPCFLASKICKKKIIYDAHEYFTETPEVERRPRIKKVWEWVAAIFIPKISFCYTVGEVLAKIFSMRYHVDFETIKNVPFLDSIKNETAQTSKICHIIYQGALNEGRGLEAAIAAMHHIEGARLWLVGEGDLSEVLRGVVEREGLREKVIFWGWVTPDKLKYLTAQAHIGINFLEARSLSYYYSLANKFFDCIQAHIPQITMRFPEYENICKVYEVAILIEKAESQAIIHAIRQLMNDKTKYIQLQKASVEAAQVYCWENETAKLYKFYEKVFS